jgi:hypothetical protein
MAVAEMVIVPSDLDLSSNLYNQVLDHGPEPEGGVDSEMIKD